MEKMFEMVWTMAGTPILYPQGDVLKAKGAWAMDRYRPESAISSVSVRTLRTKNNVAPRMTPRI